MSHDEDTIDNVYLQLAELETLVQQAAEAHTHAWGHPAEEDQDVAKAAHLLREEHQSDVVRQDGGTSSQPAGLAAAQPQLPLRALRTLRVLEPFLVGQERDLILQAMGDLSSWSTQFWGHPIVLTADDDHTQLDQPEDEREPAAEGHQLVEDLWQSMDQRTPTTVRQSLCLEAGHLNLRENRKRVGHPKHPLKELHLTAAEYTTTRKNK